MNKQLTRSGLLGLIIVPLFLAPVGQAQDPSPAGTPLSEQVAQRLRNRLEASGTSRIEAGSESIHASIVLPRFYAERLYKPAWSGDRGPLSIADALVQAIMDAGTEGLTPQDYHLDRIRATLAEIRQNQAAGRALNAGRLTDLELLLTDAFLIYGAHLLAGRTDPMTIHSQWFANRREADLAQVLENAIRENQIGQSLRRLLPPQDGYARLRDALAKYRDIAAQGGWPSVDPGPKLEKGASGDRVGQLRKRLQSSGDVLAIATANPIFDESLVDGVKKFQMRYGLEPDGVVGPATLEVLNVSAEQRVEQIRVNLERWRWLPQDLGGRHILVNIPNFEMYVREGKEVVLRMRAVVGRNYRKTPVFSSEMTYLVLNPYWNVPPNIAVQDKLPLIRKDPGYLVEQKMKVYQGWGAEAREIDPFSVDWNQIAARGFPFRLRQDPGPLNALGKFKFMFPNQFNVYLHDTPSRELFSRATRNFSSGCIRLENPMELAEYLLKDDARWSRARIMSVLNSTIDHSVPLPRRIPVHLLYWTAWVDDEGTVQFRQDIYDRDAPVAAALREQP